MQLQAQRSDHLQNRGELWIAARREGLVETLANKACFARDMRHTLGSRDIAERRSDERRVTLLERCFEVRGHICLGGEVFGWIPGRSDSLWHFELLQLTSECLGLADIAILCCLVASSEQDDEFGTLLNEIHAITRTEVHPKLGDTLTDSLDIAWIAERKLFGCSIPQTRVLGAIGCGLANFEIVSQVQWRVSPQCLACLGRWHHNGTTLVGAKSYAYDADFEEHT